MVCVIVLLGRTPLDARRGTRDAFRGLSRYGVLKFYVLLRLGNDVEEDIYLLNENVGISCGSGDYLDVCSDARYVDCI